jgi:hypothetical protein
MMKVKIFGKFFSKVFKMAAISKMAEKLVTQ